jgi:hypothetical protein
VGERDEPDVDRTADPDQRRIPLPAVERRLTSGPRSVRTPAVAGPMMVL